VPKRSDARRGGIAFAIFESDDSPMIAAPPMNMTRLACQLCGSPATEFRVGERPLYRLTCQGQERSNDVLDGTPPCGEYDYSKTLFASMLPRPNWEADRIQLARGLREGLIGRRVFETITDIQKALGDLNL
jgi:hypothetical protein